MKILHILYSGLGGHGNVFFSMLNADKEKEFSYEALFNGVEEIREEYVERCTKLEIPFTFIKKARGKHILFFYKIYKAIKNSNAEIIFIHGGVLLPPVLLVNFFSFKKRRIIIRETQAIHLKSKRERLALKLAMRFADKVVFLSEAYACQIQKDLGKKYKGSKVCVIPNGIDLNVFSVKNNRADSIVKLGMQSRIVSIKDHVTLLHAFLLLRERHPQLPLKLYIAGDGEQRTELENKVKILHLTDHVVFVGMLPEKDLPVFLHKLDVYIHASLGETMSTAIMQAMACGKAIVASDVDGINNMITNGITGLLVKVQDKEQMATAISSLITDKALRNRLETAALETAKNTFSDRLMFLRYKKIFQ